jgi:hypothetical protein
MKRTNIYLDEDLDRLLRYLALEQRRSFTDLVREVLLDYVQQQGFPDPSRVRPPLKSVRDPEWRKSFTTALAEIHAGIRTDLTPEEIEALITEVSEEARQERLAQTLTPHG